MAPDSIWAWSSIASLRCASDKPSKLPMAVSVCRLGSVSILRNHDFIFPPPAPFRIEPRRRVRNHLLFSMLSFPERNVIRECRQGFLLLFEGKPPPHLLSVRSGDML